MSNKKFTLDTAGDPPVSGLNELLNTGPESIDPARAKGSNAAPTGGNSAAPTPPQPAQSPRPVPAADPLLVYEQRMVANFASRRNPLNITAAATPELKAKLAVISRAAEDTLGSRQFTESAVIRGLVELLVVDAGIDWREALGALSPELAARPVEAIKEILREHL